MLASQSLVPDVAMELGSVEVVKEMAALGFGVGVVPAFAVERESSTGQLETRRFLPRRHVRELGIVHAGRESLSAAAQVFIALSREILGGGRRP
jgi:DNA-binding transcriptional LysR family regulator